MTDEAAAGAMFGAIFASLVLGVLAVVFGVITISEGHRKSGFTLIAVGVLLLTPPLVRLWLAVVLG